MPPKSVRLDDRANVYIREKLNMPPETAWKLQPNAQKQNGSYTLKAVLPQVRGKRGQKKKYFMDSAKFCVDKEARLSFATKEEAESATNRMDAACRLVRYVLSANANKRNSGCSGTANSRTKPPKKKKKKKATDNRASNGTKVGKRINNGRDGGRNARAAATRSAAAAAGGHGAPSWNWVRELLEKSRNGLKE